MNCKVADKTVTGLKIIVTIDRITCTRVNETHAVTKFPNSNCSSTSEYSLSENYA
jgi:hypothetical protein